MTKDNLSESRVLLSFFSHFVNIVGIQMVELHCNKFEVFDG